MNDEDKCLDCLAKTCCKSNLEHLLTMIDCRVYVEIKEKKLKEHNDFIKGLYVAKQMVIDQINKIIGDYIGKKSCETRN